MKTVNLLNEIKRVKEIMGFSLINEGLPGGFADLFTPLLKNEDELRIKKIVNIKRTNDAGQTNK